MGYSERRYLTSGAVRFYAYARDLAGKRHYVGAYPSEVEANVAWGQREIAYGRGEPVDDESRRRLPSGRTPRRTAQPCAGPKPQVRTVVQLAAR